MIYRYVDYDPTHFCANLRRDTESHNLIWDFTPGQEALVVQTPFRTPLDPMGEELCAALSGLELPAGQYREALPGVWVRYITPGDYVRARGCPVLSEACTYTVLSCSDREGERLVCRPAPNGWCHIPLDIPVMVRQSTRTRGVGPFKRQEPSGFFAISFPQPPAGELPDGDLCYRVGDFEVPITGAMLERRTVYVKSDQRPEPVSKNQGLRLILK